MVSGSRVILGGWKMFSVGGLWLEGSVHIGSKSDF